MNPNIIVYGWVCPFQFQIAPLGFSQCPKIHSLSSPRKLRKRTQVNQNSSTGQSPGNVLHKYCFTHPSSIIDNCLDVQKPLFEVGLYHSMVKVGRNFWRSSGPTSFRTHYPGLCTDVFCISLVKKDSITSLGNLLTACCHPHSEVFPHNQTKHSVFSLCPLLLILSLDNTKRVWQPSLQKFVPIDQITPKPSLPHAERAQLC